jgi:hypothetical protein
MRDELLPRRDPSEKDDPHCGELPEHALGWPERIIVDCAHLQLPVEERRD